MRCRDHTPLPTRAQPLAERPEQWQKPLAKGATELKTRKPGYPLHPSALLALRAQLLLRNLLP